MYFVLIKPGTITTGNMNVVEIDEKVASELSSYLAYFEDENATSRALKNYLTCEKKWDVDEIGAFSSKNKYSYIQLKEVVHISLGLMNFQDLKKV